MQLGRLLLVGRSPTLYAKVGLRPTRLLPHNLKYSVVPQKLGQPQMKVQCTSGSEAIKE